MNQNKFCVGLCILFAMFSMNAFASVTTAVFVHENNMTLKKRVNAVSLQIETQLQDSTMLPAKIIQTCSGDIECLTTQASKNQSTHLIYISGATLDETSSLLTIMVRSIEDKKTLLEDAVSVDINTNEDEFTLYVNSLIDKLPKEILKNKMMTTVDVAKPNKEVIRKSVMDNALEKSMKHHSESPTAKRIPEVKTVSNMTTWHWAGLISLGIGTAAAATTVIISSVSLSNISQPTQSLSLDEGPHTTLRMVGIIGASASAVAIMGAPVFWWLGQVRE
jgi:hypothetical protein